MTQTDTEIAPAKAKTGPMSWVLSEKDLAALNAAIWESSSVVFDLETTGLDEHATRGGESNGGVAARVVLATFTLPRNDGAGEWDGTEPTSWILPLSHPDSPWSGKWRKTYRSVASAVKDAGRPVIAHNAKFDLRWTFAAVGVDLSGQLGWDTRISSHLLDENRSTRLKARAPETFNVQPWDDVDLTYPGAAEEADLMHLGEYAAMDTYWCWKLYEAHSEQLFLTGDSKVIGPQDEEELQEARLGRLATWVAMPTVAGLTRVEQRGFILDEQWCARRLEAEEETHTLALDSLSETYSLDRAKATSAPTSKWFAELTERAMSMDDLKVTALTGTGKPQWNKSVLEKQAREGSWAADTILLARNAAKRAEFLRSWLGMRSEDGAIHASYNAGAVVTGRLSSSSPNMQQVTKKLRPAFIPRPGYVLADIDYSQIELRVAAHISRCAPMIEAFNRGDDLHRLLAARIAHKAPEDVTPEERQKGKSANFGLLYGMGAAGFQTYAETAYGVDMSMEEASAVHAAFFDQWEGMREWHIKAAHAVRRTGEAVSPIGRVRRLPEAFNPDDRVASKADRNALNSPVQGFASDLMQLATASITGTLAGFQAVPGAHVVATVHDSVVVELEEDRWETALSECVYRMTKGITGPLKSMGVEMTVPIKADAVVGSRWGHDDIKTEDD